MGLILSKISKVFKEFNVQLNLEVKDGELTTLLGPSGCGKTTTLQIISGIIKPDSGSIILNGNDITGADPWKRDIGIVFQDYALFPHLKVAGNISYGLKRKKAGKEEITETVRKYLKLVHLEGYGERTIDSLSGGEKQRVAIARALAPEPGILLLDEPLSALDASLRKNLRREIRRIQQQLKLTTVYVTHDQEEALTISDSLVIMNRGRVEQHGTPPDIFNKPATKFAAEFLGHSNLIEGEVTAVEGNYGIKARLKDKTEISVPYFPGFKPGDPVWIFFRSGRTELCSYRKDTENALSGTLLLKEYYGTHTLFEVYTNGAFIKAESRHPLSPEKKELTPGQEVFVSVQREYCYLIERLSRI